MEHTLPQITYSYDTLEPFIDAKTMEIHHTKHHHAYVTNLNGALKDEPTLATLNLDKLLRNLNEVPESIRTAVRNHGGGHANHSFFWPSLKKDVEAKGPVVDAIIKKFGSFDAFKEQFATAAVKLFGSGWAWLVVEKGELGIVTTPNQDNPIMTGLAPVLGVDVWEHAYYLLYQNRRPDYVANFFKVINWEKINEYYLKAMST
ncbi:superoxide dismutase [Desulfobulbus rhabdoformis]|uniref:superoxide dismutase n=1 Tax=Desulfobulbus rhabdoformis TaxID=34032 RepID=UPI0019637F11|nr:superoxide dismutase [Desulfobulbus rhabdoformis]MBM9614553.1 superoxide dismutase [Desulfobulbus rhabdoformis]